MDMNPEAILDELNDFEKREQEVTPILEEYLLKIAKTGNIIHPWCKLKPLLKRKMELVITEFCKTCPLDSIPSYPNTDKFEYESLKTTILEAVDIFSSAPFTIQRLCELITNPKKHYSRTDKYMRGLEKNLLVVSTIEPGENETSNEREPAAVNDWVNSDSSDEVHNFTDVATGVSTSTPAVNGTVLENFATVFPSATRIANKGNNIQVAIVTDTNVYPSEADDDLEYEVIDSSDMKEGDVNYENDNEAAPADSMRLVISSVSSNSEDHDQQSFEKPSMEEETFSNENEAKSCKADEGLGIPEEISETDDKMVSVKDETIQDTHNMLAIDENKSVPSECDSMMEINNKMASEVETTKKVDDEMVIDESTKEVNEKIEEMKVTVVSTEEDAMSSKGNIAAEAETDCSDEPDAKRRKFEHNSEDDNQESCNVTSSASDAKDNMCDTSSIKTILDVQSSSDNAETVVDKIEHQPDEFEKKKLLSPVASESA